MGKEADHKEKKGAVVDQRKLLNPLRRRL